MIPQIGLFYLLDSLVLDSTYARKYQRWSSGCSWPSSSRICRLSGRVCVANHCGSVDRGPAPTSLSLLCSGAQKRGCAGRYQTSDTTPIDTYRHFLAHVFWLDCTGWTALAGLPATCTACENLICRIRPALLFALLACLYLLNALYSHT